MKFIFENEAVETTVLYTSLSSYHSEFSSYETGSWGEKPEKNARHIRKQNLACLTCALCGSRTHTRHRGEMIEWLSAVMKYQRL